MSHWVEFGGPNRLAHLDWVKFSGSHAQKVEFGGSQIACWVEFCRSDTYWVEFCGLM